MQKMQIRFPDPLMGRLREVARRVDLPVSVVVRRATESWLERFSDGERGPSRAPVVNAGRCLVRAKDLRDAIYD